MIPNDWSKELKKKFYEFEKKAKFIAIEGTVMMSEDTYLRLVELIDWAREEAEIETQETVNEWYPDQVLDMFDR